MPASLISYSHKLPCECSRMSECADVPQRLLCSEIPAESGQFSCHLLLKAEIKTCAIQVSYIMLKALFYIHAHIY